MDHVYDHMKSEYVDHNCLRNDDHFTIVTLWKDLEDAHDSGNGISLGEMEFLYTEHVRPRGVTWSWAADRLGEMRPKKEGTGERNDLQTYDMRSEERGFRRRARESRAQGKATDMSGPSGGRQSGGRA
jgi:hypothetical protein